MRYQWLLLDADGTLYDYDGAESTALRETFLQTGHAFRRMGQPKKGEVLMVGDSLAADMRGAIDYGIDACWFNPQGLDCPPDVRVQYEIRSLSELAAVVRSA